jgi:uncharacterized protein (TIGR03435 family)
MKPLLLITLNAGLLFSQAPAGPRFEVASVHPSPGVRQDGVAIGVHADGAQVRINALPMRDYVARAYRVRQLQVIGPEWLTSERYDVSAKLPDGATSDQIPEMIQALLLERFQLKAHREKRDLPAYVITSGKPPLNMKLLPPDTNPPAPKGTGDIQATGSAAGVSVDLGNGSSYTFANGVFTGHKLTMDQLARMVERYVDRPIVDMTDQPGSYDFSFKVSEEDNQVMLIHAALGAGMQLPPQVVQFAANGSVSSLMDGFQSLGLKMESRKAPIDVVVVDSLNKTPSEN